MMQAIFALMFLSLSASAQSAGSCFRYIYADATKALEGKMPVYACRDIVKNKATNCDKIGSLDTKRIENAKNRALEKMWAFGTGLAAGYSCQLGVMAVPMAFRTTGVGLNAGQHVDRRVAKDRMAQKAYENVLNHTREPGSPPSKARGEIVPTGVSQGCSWIRRKISGETTPSKINARDAYNLGVDTALSHFSSSAAASAVLSGDAQALEKLYQEGSIEHKEAVRRFHERIEAERKKQAIVLNKIREMGDKFYKFMMDNSLTTIAFGTSPDGVDEKLPCIAPKAEQLTRTKLCDLARATAKIETYVPGDLFEAGKRAVNRKIAGAEQVTKDWVAENCKTETPNRPGILEKTDPGFPPIMGP